MEENPVSVSLLGVTKSFARTVALDAVTLDLEAGLMHGVIGPEGAGKTTLMRLILGLMKPTAGKVAFARGGRPASLEEVRPLIAYLPQQQSLYADLSVDEHLEFFRALYGIPEDAYRAKREELLRIARLSDFVDRPAGQLSGGMYKKLGLMCALLRSPEAIVLDEPTSGVDPISRRELWNLLYRLSDQKILIVVATATMGEAQRCSRVHLLEDGRLIAGGEPRELLAREGAASFEELFKRRA